MKLFQFVGDRTAEAILKDGFSDLLFKDLKKDGQDLKGVWLLDSIDCWQKELGGVDIEGGQVMLAVDIPEDALTGLEIVIAFLQAFVFAILTCLYLNDALHLH